MRNSKVFKFPTGTVTKESFDWIANKPTQKLVTWVINSQYRTAVSLKTWMRTQLNLKFPPTELEKCDLIVISELKKTIATIKYRSDKDTWKMTERWQTIDETLDLKTGDCEDGAMYLYGILRELGVPDNRLMLIAGDVEDPGSSKLEVGHCWLAYKPDDYPLNWVFLDWCYWPDTQAIGKRDFYHVAGQNIYRINAKGEDIKSKYHRIWFAFNSTTSHVSLSWGVK